MARRAGALAGRGIGKAWTASKPHRATSRKATGRALKKLRGAAWDGLKSAAAGLWALRSKKHRSGAVDRMREAWARHRKTRAEKAKAKADAAEQTTVGTTVRRPTAIPATFTGGTTMSGYHFVAPAAEAARAAANYQPTGMMQVGADFAGLQEALELHAQAMRTTVENADAKFPLAPQIIEIMQQIHGLQIKAAELAQELEPAFRKLHEVDIARIENPRKGHHGERMWDVASNI